MKRSPTLNLVYVLSGDEIASREATPKELADARQAAHERLRADPGSWALRSCWVCNPAHAHFLNDTADGWILRCFSCGRVYYQGIDITEGDEPEEADRVKTD